MTRRGKCQNVQNCLVAYRDETITTDDAEFVCPECKQALQPLSAAAEKPPRTIPTLIVGGILTLALLGVIGVWLQVRRIPATPPVSNEEQTRQALQNQGSLIPPRAVPAASATTESGAPEAEPAPVQAVKAPNLNVESEENKRVKAEVLKRIDLMPTISADNKDKLYMSVERARRMGKVLTIPFGKGLTSLAAGDAEKIKTEIASPQLQQLMQDPTCVFVILGFADKKGDEKTNLRISTDRAQNTLTTLRDKCGVINVMHSVGMGGLNLLDDQGAEKNRASEIWAVLP